MITIKEMAEIAGVSPTTVANILHGRTNKASEATIRKVQKIIEQSNYVSNMGARILGNYGSRIIAVVVSYAHKGKSNLLQDPFAGTIIGIMEQKISSQGYFMMLYTNPDVEECLHMALAWNVEGLILLGMNRDQYYLFRSRLEVPIVTVDTYFRKEDKAYVNIGLEDYRGGYQMTEYLVQKGHKRIAFLDHAPGGGIIDTVRYQGYLDALSAHRLKKNAKCIALPRDHETREKKMKEIAREDFCGCTALFFSADYLAIEGMNVFLDDGFHIPEDISIAGFDDIPAASQCRPRLTTMRQDIFAKGEHSVEKIIEMIKGKNPGNYQDIKEPVELIERGSVKTLC